MLLHKDREQFIAIVNAVSNELSIPIPIVEKDYVAITSYFQKTRVEYDKAIEAVKKIIELDIF